MWSRRALVIATTIGLMMSMTVHADAARPRYPCSMQKKVNGRWVGTLSLTDANRLRARAVRLGENVAGVRRNEVTQADAPYIIRCVFSHYGLDWRKALAVATCESHHDPEALNPDGPYLGMWQYLPSTWRAASARYSHRGASAYDGYASTHVTAQYVRDGGWGPWGCA